MKQLVLVVVQEIKIIPHKDLNINKIKKLLSLEISKLNKGEISILKKQVLSKKMNQLKLILKFVDTV